MSSEYGKLTVILANAYS